MAEVQWPAGLQQKLNSDSFQETLGETLIRSSTDVGPAKFRRRLTRGTKGWTVSILGDTTAYTELVTFFNTTVAGGATRFEFDHPISGVTELVRFAEPPVIKTLGSGGVKFSFSMKWEVLPRG